MSVASPAREIAELAARRLRELYGSRMQALYLYGSYARGDERPPDSDIDLAIVLDDFESPCAEIDRMGEISADIALEHGIVVSIQPLTVFAFSGDISRLSRIVHREGLRIS